MASFEAWRTQHDADKMFEYLGFKERLIHGVRIYYNMDTGESLDLHRPKYLSKKAIQKGINISEGILERLAEAIKELDLSDEQKEKLRQFYLSEKNELNKMNQGLDLKDNL